MTVLRNNYRIGLNVDDYWSLSTLESGRQSDECEACLSQTRHETYTSVTLGAVGIIIVLVVSFVFLLHFFIKSISTRHKKLLQKTSHRWELPCWGCCWEQWVHQLNMCKTMVQSLAHTFVGCYTGCVPLFKTLSVPADYVRDNGTQAQSLADTFSTINTSEMFGCSKHLVHQLNMCKTMVRSSKLLCVGTFATIGSFKRLSRV